MASTRKESVTSLRFVTLSLRFSTAPYCFIRFFLPQLLTKSQKTFLQNPATTKAKQFFAS